MNKNLEKKNTYDRLVREIHYSSKKIEVDEPKLFSEYQNKKNIILLGEPGMGKTFLFKNYTNFYTASNFIATYEKNFNPDDIVYIDGLDEIRNNGDNKGNIDTLLRNLQKFNVKKVRISCRETDWSGINDLNKFKPYTDNTDNFIILRLEILSHEEQKVILESLGSSEPDNFINEAIRRNIKTFLENPLTLIMLYEAIEAKKEWPKTKKELFKESINILLKENNEAHLYSDIGKFTSDELYDYAGAICAVRLISGIEGISLKNNENDNSLNYRKFIPIFSSVDETKILSTLCRRVFISTSEKSVDYIHRSIAEYLGAAWLAKQIGGSLPISRILALIIIGGHSVSALRGLYGWLVVFLTAEIAHQFIDKDPYTVLIYSDVASFCPSKRKRLIKALCKLSKNNPSFYTDWGTHNFSFLSHEDLKEDLKEILSIQESNSLKYIVLLSLIESPLLELKSELFEIFENQSTDYNYRTLALKALVKISESLENIKEDIYSKYKKLEKNMTGLQLRSLAISEFYGKIFSSNDILILIRDGLNYNEKLPSTIFWKIHSRISLDDIIFILNGSIKALEDSSNSEIDFEIYSIFAAMIERAIYLNKEKENDAFAKKLWEWLKIIDNNYRFIDYGGTKKIKKALIECPELIDIMVNTAIDSLEIEEDIKFSIFYTLPKILLWSISEFFLLEKIVERILFSKDKRDKLIFLYEIAILQVLNIQQVSISIPIFEKLYGFCDEKENFEDFLAIRTRCCSCEIDKKGLYDPSYDTLKEREKRTKQDNEKKSEIRKELIADFEKNKELIQTGKHQDWLVRITQFYFGFYSDLDETCTPHERLEQNFGHENALIALDGLIACLQHKEIPSLQEIILTKIENKPIPVWWCVIIASLNEKYIKNPDLSELSEDLIQAVFAIDLIYPITYYKYDASINAKVTLEYEWKNALLDSYRNIAKNVYFAFAEASFKNKDSYNIGLSELLSKDIFMPFLPEIVLNLLRKFPEASLHYIREMLCTALEFYEIYDSLLLIIKENLKKVCISDLDEKRKELWLIVAYFISPKEFGDKFQKYAMNLNNSNIVWTIRDMFSYKIINRNKSLLESKITQIEFFCRVIASHYKNCIPPNGVVTGDRNSWDASRFIQTLIYYLSKNTAEESTKALSSLRDDKIMNTYYIEIKHALALHLEKRREKKYQLPTLDGIIKALSNRVPETRSDFLSLAFLHMEEINEYISRSDTDPHKAFWNLDSDGKIIEGKHKPENNCRDTLIDFLRDRLKKYGINVSPEIHLSRDRRGDICIYLAEMKIIIELKCDDNQDIWVGAKNQLEHYISDPDCNGYGIYGVFWFGEKRGKLIKCFPNTKKRPQSAKEMEEMLNSLISEEEKDNCKVIVIDVSGEVSSDRESIHEFS